MNAPLVLFPAGPFGWSSYDVIYPALEKIWKSLEFEIAKVWFPRPSLTPEFVERCRAASCLVFPLGLSHLDSLWTLTKLRRDFACATPAVVMLASDLTAGYQGFLQNMEILTSRDRFVTNCSVEADLFRFAFGTGPRASVNVSPIALPVFPFAKKRSVSRKALGLSSSDEVVLYAGRISAQKNLHGLIASFKAVLQKRPRAKLFIAGGADEIGYPRVKNQNERRYIHELSQLVVALGLENEVKFLGVLSQDELAAWFDVASLHVSLTVHSGEDFGYSIAQGLVAGVPTLVTEWGGGHDFVADSGAQGLRVHVTANGPKVSVAKAAERIVELLGRSKRPSANGLKPRAIEKRWRAVTTFGADVGRTAPVALKVNRKLRLRTVGRGPHFATARDPMYQAICRIYARETVPTKRVRHEWNLMFDPRESFLWDPVSELRRFKFSRSEKEFVGKWWPRAVDISRLPGREKKIARDMIDRALLLPL
ncbi:MAG: glycosyltransferase family 4 protein [Bdellovibrionota bacterium]